MNKKLAVGTATVGTLVTLLVTGSAAQAKPCIDCSDAGGGGGVRAAAVKHLPNDAPRDVTIRLLSVRASDTEDVASRGDELYLVGALRAGQKTADLQLAPTTIQAGDSIGLTTSLAQQRMTGDEQLSVVVTAKDQDFARDWQEYGPVVTGVGAAIYGAALAIPVTAPFALAAAPFVAGAYATFNAFALADRDDVLADRLTIDQRVGDFPLGTSTRSFRVAGTAVPYWSDWDYTITYSVTISRAGSL